MKNGTQKAKSFSANMPTRAIIDTEGEIIETGKYNRLIIGIDATAFQKQKRIAIVSLKSNSNRADISCSWNALPENSDLILKQMSVK